ncbi:MAG: hypothetical protein V9G14_04265 [Cypionkella sp.]
MEIAVEVPEGGGSEGSWWTRCMPSPSASQSITSRIVVISGQPARRDDRVGGACGRTRSNWWICCSRELELKRDKLDLDLHHKTLVQLFVENRIYKRIETAKTADAVIREVYEGFKPLTQADAPGPDR